MRGQQKIFYRLYNAQKRLSRAVRRMHRVERREVKDSFEKAVIVAEYTECRAVVRELEWLVEELGIYDAYVQWAGKRQICEAVRE